MSAMVKLYKVVGEMVGLRACPCPSCPDGGTHHFGYKTVDLMVGAKSQRAAERWVRDKALLDWFPGCKDVQWLRSPIVARVSG